MGESKSAPVKDRATPEELAEKVTRLIRSGRLDTELDELAEILWNRRKYLNTQRALQNVMSVEAGDRVRILSELKPRYLAGLSGTVIEVSNRRRSGVPMVLVQLDHPAGKFRNGRILLSGASFRVTQQADNVKQFGQVTDEGWIRSRGDDE